MFLLTASNCRAQGLLERGRQKGMTKAERHQLRRCLEPLPPAMPWMSASMPATKLLANCQLYPT